MILALLTIPGDGNKINRKIYGNVRFPTLPQASREEDLHLLQLIGPLPCFLKFTQKEKSQVPLQAKSAEECFREPTCAICQVSVTWEILKQKTSFNKQTK